MPPETIRLHTICSLLSYAAFLVAFVSGVLFLIQERQLKHKRMGVLFHQLPSLGALDRINVVSLGVGFGLLTLGMTFGLLGFKRVSGTWWAWSPKEAVTVALWACYFLLWLVRLRTTLRGRKVALLSILGFSLVLFSWLGVSHRLPPWHASLPEKSGTNLGFSILDFGLARNHVSPSLCPPIQNLKFLRYSI